MVLHASTPQTGFFQQLSRRSSADVQRLFSRARETMLNNSSDLTQSPCRSTAILPIVVTESLKTNVRVCVCVQKRKPQDDEKQLTNALGNHFQFQGASCVVFSPQIAQSITQCVCVCHPVRRQALDWSFPQRDRSKWPHQIPRKPWFPQTSSSRLVHPCPSSR